MMTLQALILRDLVPMGIPYFQNLGRHGHGLFLSYDSQKGWNLVRLNCIQIMLRCIGFYSSTHLKKIYSQMQKEIGEPSLHKRINGCWLRKMARPGESFLIGNTYLTTRLGDITKQNVEAIVNPTELNCLEGSIIHKAIHAAAGPAFRAECEALPERAPNVRCLTGEAVITGKGNLPNPIRHVIHAVGPVWDPADPNGSTQMLEKTYRSCLDLAHQNNIRTIAFPPIRTRRFDSDSIALIAFKVVENYVLEHPDHFDEVRFVGNSLGSSIAQSILRFIPRI